MLDPVAKNKTRSRLIESGLHLFGKNGFEGTSTRDLAARADTNVASIAYHFGGKAGLRAACARALADQIAEVLDAQGISQPPGTPQEALVEIERIVGAFVQLLVGTPQAGDMVAFMLRELTDPGEIAAMIYTEFLEPRHIALCTLWAKATGRAANDEQVKLAVFSMIGQVLYFRIARPFVGQRMGWDGIGREETQKVADIVIANLRDTIERHRI